MLVEERPYYIILTPKPNSPRKQVIIDWPELEERADPTDVGHNTTGPGVGRHRSRTLESLSLKGKVRRIYRFALGVNELTCVDRSA